MTDQTVSEYAELLRSCEPLAESQGDVNDLCNAVRALEANVRESDALLRSTIERWQTTIDDKYELRADRDRLAGEVRSGELAVVSLTKALGDEQDRAAELAGKVERLVAIDLAGNEQHEMMEKMIDRLTAELAEARKDVARVDWLATYPREATHTTDDGPPARVMFWGVSAHPSISLREAIDAARSAGGEG